MSVPQSTKPGVFADHYVLGPHLGSGSFGLVYKCFMKEDPSRQYAVKTIKKTDSLSPDDIETVFREVDILRCLDGVNHVVQLVDFFDDENYYMIILELCRGGELFYRIINKKRYTEKDAAKVSPSHAGRPSLSPPSPPPPLTLENPKT